MSEPLKSLPLSVASRSPAAETGPFSWLQNVSDTVSTRHTILSWFLLGLIPLLALGWTVGRYGPVSDDWAMLRYAEELSFFARDHTRPIAFLSPTLAYYMAGGSVTGMYVQIVLLHIVETILCFEVLRQLLQRRAYGFFLAFAGAAMYAVYLSDVSRHTIMMIHGRWMQIAFFGMMLVWMSMIRRPRWWLVFPLVTLLLSSVLTKESMVIIYGLLPVMLIIYFREKLLKYWATLGLWYGVLLVWGVWRFIIAEPRNARNIVLPSLEQGISDLLQSLYRTTLGSFSYTLQEHSRAITLNDMALWLPFAVALITGGAVFFVLFLLRKEPVERLSRWQLFSLISGGVLLTIAGIVPYLVRGTGGIIATSIHSRDTQAAIFGLVLLFIALPALFRYSRVIVALLCTVVVTFSVMRQVYTGADYVTAWTMQQHHWQAILQHPLDLGFSINPQTSRDARPLTLLHNFPEDYGNGITAVHPWAYTSGFALMTPGRVDTLVGSGITHVYAEDQHLKIVFGNTLRPWSPSLEHVRVLVYDDVTGRVSLSAQMPPELLAPDAEPIPLYTGVNTQIAPPALTPFGASLLTPLHPPAICQTMVSVTTEDGAPASGDVTVFHAPDQGVIDRRRVAAGEPLNYNFLAPCGVWLQVYHQPDGGENAYLPSQYGPDVYYGSSDTAESIPYYTAFAQASNNAEE